jgi:uncharacterized membrane protein
VNEVLGVLAVLGSGTISGAFFAVAVSVTPALSALPPDRYVEAHRLLGKGYHPIMPIMANLTMATGIWLAFVAPSTAGRVVAGVAAALTLGVQGVSHLGNVPINRSLAAADPGSDGWPDPRPRWRFLHLVRTALAAAVFVLFSLALVLHL